jgi:hypothetical protein
MMRDAESASLEVLGPRVFLFQGPAALTASIAAQLSNQMLPFFGYCFEPRCGWFDMHIKKTFGALCSSNSTTSQFLSLQFSLHLLRTLCFRLNINLLLAYHTNQDALPRFTEGIVIVVIVTRCYQLGRNRVSEAARMAASCLPRCCPWYVEQNPHFRRNP